jgi:hypothetical protein
MLFSGCSKEQKNKATILPISELKINEAIEYGIQNSELSNTEFISDWTVALGYGHGKGSATLITPFLTTALLSKQAQMQRQQINRNLLEKLILEDADFLIFEVILFGEYPQFGKSTEFVLKYDDKEIQPAYQFLPSYAEMGRDYIQTSKGRVKFTKDTIPDNSKVVLEVQFNMVEDPQIKDKYICEFEFDLSKLK